MNGNCRGFFVKSESRLSRWLCLALIIASVAIGLYLLPVLLAFIFVDGNSHDGARELAVFEVMDTVLSASKHYHNDCGKWPDLSEGLAPLVQEDHVERWNGPYIPHRLLSDGLLCDSWGNQYRVLMTQTRLSLASAGHDGMFETSDDIVGSVTLESGTVIGANVKGLTKNGKFVFPSSQEELSCRK